MRLVSKLAQTGMFTVFVTLALMYFEHKPSKEVHWYAAGRSLFIYVFLHYTGLFLQYCNLRGFDMFFIVLYYEFCIMYAV